MKKYQNFINGKTAGYHELIAHLKKQNVAELSAACGIPVEKINKVTAAEINQSCNETDAVPKNAWRKDSTTASMGLKGMAVFIFSVSEEAG